MSFAKDFAWGVASAAYQIEGGVTEGGRAPSIWDTFSHTPGKTFHGHTGDVAADHFHRWAEDLDLIAALGCKHYRFSVSWPRILSQRDGSVNSEGLAFYDNIVNGCIQRGITPYLTLYHWDLPQYLQDEGGWLNRATAERFADLARAVGQHFKGRVTHYFTINEPQCAATKGYGDGQHAPGLRLSGAEQVKAIHHLNLAHGLACLALRRADPAVQIGVASTGRLCYPEPDTPENRAAARQRTFSLQDGEWAFFHHWFLDPLVLGRYPDAPNCFLQAEFDKLPAEDLKLINQPLDFIGLNIYNGNAVCAGPNGEAVYVPKHEGFPRTALKWPVTPEVMRFGVKAIYDRYQLPIYITEQGQSCNDRIFLDGSVHDPDRIDFLQRYLHQLELAVEEGAEVRGYFHWCFTDNFEWHSGYDDRFGLVYVDYPTQRRIPKDSYYWYRDRITQGN